MTPEELAAIKAHLDDVFVWDGHHESTIEHARALVEEVERLQRIEAAAKAVDASWAESWDCSAHPQHGKHFEAIGNSSAALRAAESGE